jgi:hypothetical protein
MADTDTLPKLSDDDVAKYMRAVNTGTLPKGSLNTLVPEAAASRPLPAPARLPSIGAAPEIATPAPTSLPSMAPVAMPVKPTATASIAAGQAQHGTTAKQEGKNQFNELRPEVTAAPGTPEFFQQKIAQEEFEKSHPLGGAISAQPGFLGKLEHFGAKVGNIAGDIVAPGVMQNIPGTERNKEMEESRNLKNFGGAEENQLRNVQAETMKSENEMVPFVPPGAPAGTEPIMLSRKALAGVEAATTKGQTAEEIAANKNQTAKDIAGGKNDTARDIAAGKTKEQLLKMGYDEKGEPLPDAALSPQQRSLRDMTQAHTKLLEAQAAVTAAKNDPNSTVSKNAQAGLALRQAEYQNKLEEQGLVKPSGQTASRADAADAALKLLPGLEASVKANAKEFGPIMGRINKGEIKLGDVDPAVQKVYAQLESFYALQPSIHGFRNAEFVKDFDTFVGNLATNPDAVIAGLDGLQPTLESVRDEGRTYHKRIIEGGGAAGGANPPAAGAGGGKAVPSFSDFVAGNH